MGMSIHIKLSQIEARIRLSTAHTEPLYRAFPAQELKYTRPMLVILWLFRFSFRHYDPRFISRRRQQ